MGGAKDSKGADGDIYRSAPGDASGLTRSRFVSRAARFTIGVAVAGTAGLAGERLLDDSGARAASEPPPNPNVSHFLSRPDLRPPRITVTQHTAAAASSLFFLTPLQGPGQRGALIIDGRGEPVWFMRAPIDAANLNVGVYRAKPVLTWWQGKEVPGGVGEGEYVVADTSYRAIARFAAGLGYHSDLHDFVLTPQGTALVTVQKTVMRDLRAFGGSRNAPVIDMGFQEIDVASGKVLLHWSALDHIGVEESYKPLGGPGPYDYLHLNAVARGPQGTILLCARHTWALYNVDPRSGAILWRLGGKRSTFSMPDVARFAWQHDARWAGPSTVTLFDDGAGPDSQIESQSRGLVLDLDLETRKASVAGSYTHRPPLLAAAMGSFQPLAGGGAVLGWGTASRFTLYDRDGTVTLDAALPHGGASYRTLSYPWSGRPLDRPAIAIAPGSPVRVAVSWNGATEVAGWQLRVGEERDRLRALQTLPREGFETTFTLASAARYLNVVALDAGGAALGQSKIIAL